MKLMTFKKCFSTFLIIIAGFKTSLGQDFGYDGEKGPEHWGEQYNTCIGKYQSPININSLDVDDVCLPNLVFKGFDVSPKDGTLTNNGHTVMLTFDHEEVKPTITGGPLNGIYEFAQCHFHWGDNDTYGSEGSIDNRSFPLELHMVFFKQQYKNVSDAMTRRDGLTVLAFFFEISTADNPAYVNFTEGFRNLTEPHSSYELVDPLPLFHYLTEDWIHYYTYRGSLTTPPCYESVVWMDFKEPIPLSHQQIEHFRSLKNDEENPLTHNYRPIQPKGDRIVKYNQNIEELIAKNKTKIDLNMDTGISEVVNNNIDDNNNGKSNSICLKPIQRIFALALLTLLYYNLL